MLITQLKSYDELLSLAGDKTVIISCEGCREIQLPENEVIATCDKLLVIGTAIAVIVTDYVCNVENIKLYLQKYTGEIESSDTLLVFSCGVGVQTIASIFPSIPVYAACDTYPIPGYQGVTPSEFDCTGCQKCHLNSTGGICPVTACSKSLINGQCGGSKGGMCEVDKDIECGWDRIYKKIKNISTIQEYFTI